MLPFFLLAACISRLKGHPARKGIRGRLGIGDALPQPSKNRVLLHAVSVGEVNAIRSLVLHLQQRGYEIVMCVTTDTGLARARELFSHSCHVTRFPFDFSFAIKRFLKRTQPTIVALVELEVWPNLISTCSASGIPVIVINGRLSERSFKRYKLARFLLQSTFRKLSTIGMQNEVYANRVRQLGATNISVEGTMKWDNASITDTIAGADELATELGIDRKKPLVVAGSTAPAEHELLLQSLPKGVQLLCAPRRPEWFDEAERTFPSCNRRTKSERFDTEYFLLDTFGELDKAYALADIVVIGRSFAPLHGSDPTQSIALGKPTIIGPNVSDFEDMVQLLVEGNGLIQCSQEDLRTHISTLLNDPTRCAEIRDAGRKIIESLQGATKRYEDLIVKHLPHA